MQFLRTWRCRTVTSLSVLCLVGLVAGCSDSPTDTTHGSANVPEMSMNLALPDGGTGTNAEAPYFGDSYFATYLNENIDADVPDPMATSTQMRTAEDRPEATVLYLRVIWGNLDRGPDAPDSTITADLRAAQDAVGSVRDARGSGVRLPAVPYQPGGG